MDESTSFSTRHRGTNDDATMYHDPTATWQVQGGVHRRQAYAGRRERTHNAEMRGAILGAAELSDSPPESPPKRKKPSGYYDAFVQDRAIKARKASQIHRKQGGSLDAEEELPPSKTSGEIKNNVAAPMPSNRFSSTVYHTDSDRRLEFLPLHPPLRQRPPSVPKAPPQIPRREGQEMQQRQGDSSPVTRPHTMGMTDHDRLEDVSAHQEIAQTGDDRQSVSSDSKLRQQRRLAFLTPQANNGGTENFSPASGSSSFEAKRLVAKSKQNFVVSTLQRRLEVNSPLGKHHAKKPKKKAPLLLKDLSNVPPPEPRKTAEPTSLSPTGVHSEQRTVEEVDSGVQKMMDCKKRKTIEDNGVEQDSQPMEDDAFSGTLSDKSITPPKKRKITDNSVQNEVDFFLTEEQPTLTLIEGISTLTPDDPPDQSGSRPTQSFQEYCQKIAKQDWPIELPSIGILQDLPGAYMAGQWKAKFVPELVHPKASEVILLKEKTNGFRVCLRHASQLELGPLRSVEPTQSSKGIGNILVTSSSTDAQARRQNVFERVVRHEHRKNLDQTFIGSISVVGTGKLSQIQSGSPGSYSIVDELLRHLKEQTSVAENVGKTEESAFPPLFEILRDGTLEPTVVGFSVPIGLSLDSKCKIVIGQEESREDQPIVALDIVFSSISSPDEKPMTPAAKNDGTLVDPLTQENLKKHTKQVGRLSPVESLWGSGSSMDSLDKKQLAVPRPRDHNLSDRQSDFDVEVKPKGNRFSQDSFTEDCPSPTIRNPKPWSESSASMHEPSLLLARFEAAANALEQPKKGPRRLSFGSKQTSEKTDLTPVQSKARPSLMKTLSNRSFDSWDDDWDRSSVVEAKSIDGQSLRVSQATSQEEHVESSFAGKFHLPHSTKGSRKYCLGAVLKWVPVVALLFMRGAGRQDWPTPLADIATSRQKKHSLPPPVRLTKENPSAFKLEATTF